MWLTTANVCLDFLICNCYRIYKCAVKELSLVCSTVRCTYTLIANIIGIFLTVNYLSFSYYVLNVTFVSLRLAALTSYICLSTKTCKNFKIYCAKWCSCWLKPYIIKARCKTSTVRNNFINFCVYIDCVSNQLQDKNIKTSLEIIVRLLWNVGCIM